MTETFVAEVSVSQRRSIPLGCEDVRHSVPSSFFVSAFKGTALTEDATFWCRQSRAFEQKKNSSFFVSAFKGAALTEAAR